MKNWGWVLGMCAALQVIVATAFFLHEIETPQAAAQLGYGGVTADVTVVPTDEYQGSESLSSRLEEFTSSQGLSVAYIRSYDSGIITLLDDQGRFQNSVGPLALDLGSEGAGDVLISSEFGLSEDAVARLVGADTQVTNKFLSDVMFWDRYPVILASPMVVPFDYGVYTFAGQGVDADQIASLFDEQGLEIVEIGINDAVNVSFLGSLSRNLLSLYGMIILLFSAVLVVCVALAARDEVSRRHERYRVFAILGATRSQTLRLILRDIASVLGIGIAAGGLVSGVVAAAIRGLSVADDGARILAVVAAIGFSALSCAVVSWWVASSEARRVTIAYPR